MERITRFRAYLLLLIFVAIVALFAFRLYNLQIIETGGNTNNASTFTTKTRVRAARGELLDRNGNVLVGNRASYDLVMNHYVLLSAKGTNDWLYRLVKHCEEVGVEYNESFPISKERPFTYTFDQYTPVQQGYFQKFLAYIGDIDSDITASLLIERLRQIYDLPAQWTDEEARQVIGLRYELSLRNCVTSLGNYVFITDANDTELSAVVELNVPGLNPEASIVREIRTAYAAHIIGYVGNMTAEQWEYYKEIDGYEMDAQVGQTGLEQKYEEYLHGIDGWRVDTVSADGTLISSHYETEPKAGANVQISIDGNLQMVAEDALAAMTAELHTKPEGYDGADAAGSAVVVMDMQGQVLVCGSYPTYDLNTFFENYEEILNADNDPLYNRALLATYPPGSTYKMSTLVSAMENGKFAPGETIHTKGKFTKYESTNFAPTCLAWPNSHGTIDATVALKKSCNYFFYELSDRMSISMMDETAAALGLGEPTGVELPENQGYRSNPDTKKELFKGSDAHFTVGDRINTGIGQAENRFTPLQLCVYTCTLANQGVRYKATFLNRVVSDDYNELVKDNSPEIVSTFEISDITYDTYITGMKKVANEVGGTGYSKLKDCVVEVAAKTGTAQHGLGRKYSDHGAIVCFAPADDPQIAVAIYGEKAAHGSTLGMAAAAIINSYFSGDESTVTSAENQLS